MDKYNKVTVLLKYSYKKWHTFLIFLLADMKVKLYITEKELAQESFLTVVILFLQEYLQYFFNMSDLWHAKVFHL